MERNWSRTRDILLCIIALGVILWTVGSVLNIFIDTVVILLLSMAVAFLMSPVVDWLERYGLPRLIGALLTYLLVIGLISYFGYSLVITMIQQAQGFADQITVLARTLPEYFNNTLKYLEQQGIPRTNIDESIAKYSSQLIDFAQTVASDSPKILVGFINGFLNILLIVVMSFYLVLDGKRIRDSIVGLISKKYLSGVLLFENALNKVVGNYIRGQLFLALIVGISTGVICWANGMGNFALICGLLAFLFETIPMIGPALASIAPILLSLLLPDPLPRSLYVVLAFIILQLIESNILGPRVVGHAVGLHPVAAILALLVGAHLFGVFGALLATPIVAAAWVVLASFYRSARGETPDQILARKKAPWTIPRPGPKSAPPPEEEAREEPDVVIEHAESLEDSKQQQADEQQEPPTENKDK